MAAPRDGNRTTEAMDTVVLLPFRCPKCGREVETWTHVEGCDGRR